MTSTNFISIRITDTNQTDLYQYIQSYYPNNSYAIGVTETGKENNKHYHAVIKISIKLDTLRKSLLRRQVVKSRKYQLKADYKTFNEAFAYCTKAGIYKTNVHPDLHPPKWIPHHEYIKINKRTAITYDKLVHGYVPLTNIQMNLDCKTLTVSSNKLITQHVVHYIMDSWHGKLFNSETIQKYAINILHYHYHTNRKNKLENFFGTYTDRIIENVYNILN